KESFQLFQAMKDRVDEEIVRYLWWLRPMIGEEPPPPRAVRRPRPPLTLTGGAETAPPSPFGAPRRAPVPATASPGGRSQPQPARVGGDDAEVKTIRRDEPKVGRNDPCPCGSGKKYKKCHGAAA